MPVKRRTRAVFTEVESIRREGSAGVMLGFRPERSRIGVDRIVDFAALGPDLCLPAVAGLGKVLRLLRSARIATPADPKDFLGREDLVESLLARALGASVMLELRPRSRVRFTAWTDEGVEVVEDVSRVVEDEDAYLVMRRTGRFPVRLPRERVIRQRTDCERWYEVLDIERAEETPRPARRPSGSRAEER
jgi:hypothetical protein